MGQDSLGREWVDVFLQSLLVNSQIAIVIFFLVISFFTLLAWWVTQFSTINLRIVYIVSIIAGKGIPLILSLMLFAVLFGSGNIASLIGILLVFHILLFLPMFIEKMNSFIYSSWFQQLKFGSSSKFGQFVHFILPIYRPFLFWISIFSALNGLLLESVITFFGLGLEYGTPSFGFMVQDSLKQVYKYPMQLGAVILVLTIISLIIALVTFRTNQKQNVH